jgi:hypothetical protein
LFVALFPDVLFQSFYCKKVLNEFYSHTGRACKIKLSRTFKIRLRLYANSAYYFAKVFAVLHGKKITKIDRRNVSIAGAMLGVADYLFDNESKYAHKSLHQLITNPENYVPPSPKHHLLLSMYKSLLSTVCMQNKRALITPLLNAYNANSKSEAQKKMDIAPQYSEELSLTKGGCCGIFYRTALCIPLLNYEYEAVYEAGKVGQLIDDAIDVEEDLYAGIATVFTIQKDAAACAQIFNGRLQAAYNAIRKVPAAAGHINNAMYLFNFGAQLALAALKNGTSQPGANFTKKLKCTYIKFQLNKLCLTLIMANSLSKP